MGKNQLACPISPQRDVTAGLQVHNSYLIGVGVQPLQFRQIVFFGLLWILTTEYKSAADRTRVRSSALITESPANGQALCCPQTETYPSLINPAYLFQK